MKLLHLASASLNQTPLDWHGNLARILSAIADARAHGAAVLCLPELAISGYGCEDAFFSKDVQARSLELLREIAPHTEGMAVAVGLPVFCEGALYDCAAFVVDGRVLGIVAKRYLAGDGLHYEPRWFKPWPAGRRTELALGEESIPFGDLYFEIDGVRFGFEICEDAWASSRPGVQLAALHVDVILNPSASHFAFGKFETRKRFVLEGSRAFAAVYCYANLQGNEAGRIIYDGGSLIASGGKLAAQGPRFSFQEVMLTYAVVDLDENRLQRSKLHSFTEPTSTNGASRAAVPQRVSSPMRFPEIEPRPAVCISRSWELSPRIKEEEFTRAVALGLFDYLRKSNSRGFVVSLSGGADSAAVALLTALMVKLGLAELGQDGFRQKLAYLPSLRDAGDDRAVIESLLTCVYQATRNSSERTKEAAAGVAQFIGARFFAVSIDKLVEDYTSLVSEALGETLSWERHDTSLQNIQARVRAPLVWFIANIQGALLLATSNRSEAAVGYTTMDGDTAGGLSPIAGIDKAFLLSWLRWLEKEGISGGEPIPVLSLITSQEPTAELRPAASNQTDEKDLMPYPVLDAIERLAIRDKRSPLEAYRLLRAQFEGYSADELGQWVRRFFVLWSRNQWKRERYAPSFHVDDENLDPKTWCRFPILSGSFEKEIEDLERYLAAAK